MMLSRRYAAPGSFHPVLVGVGLIAHVAFLSSGVRFVLSLKLSQNFDVPLGLLRNLKNRIRWHNVNIRNAQNGFLYGTEHSA